MERLYRLAEGRFDRFANFSSSYRLPLVSSVGMILLHPYHCPNRLNHLQIKAN